MRDDEHDQAAAPGSSTPGTTSPDPAGVVPDVGWLHGTWHVRRVGDVDVTDGLDDPPWLTFDGDGVVFGHAGVNRVRGTWHLVEGGDASAGPGGAARLVLGFGPVVATRMAGTPAATAAERAVLRVLETGGVLERAGDRVTLRAPDGRVTELRQRPGPPPTGVT